MSQRVIFTVVLLVVAGAGPGLVAADTPSVTLSVDGERAPDGEEFVVTQNPDLSIEASAAESIESVVVRINGESARTFSPGSTSFSRTFVAQVEDNERNSVQVIVRDSAGGVQSRQLTITKDGVGPFVGFESPFESELGSRPPERASASQSRVQFTGTFEDLSGVQTLSIERRHVYTAVNERRVKTSNQQIQNPGSSFDTEVFMGYGRNVVEIRMIDELRNSRSYTIEFDVEDRTAPDLSVRETPTEVRRGSLTLSGTASDNVQVDEVVYSVEGKVDSATVISSEGDAANPDRQSMRFEQEIPLNPGENVVRVTARDVAGRTSTVRRVVTFNDTIVPVMSLEPTAVESGTVRFTGYVHQGSFQRVSVETVDPETNETLDFRQVYDGEPTGENVTFDEQMAAVDDGQTRVVLRVVDRDGDEYVRAATVRPDTDDTDDTDDGADTPTPGADDESGADEGEGNADSSGSDGAGSGGDGADGAGGEGGSGGAGSTPTVIPGFGVGHALVALLTVGFLLFRRRTD
jgi:PGF-CTERM protein